MKKKEFILKLIVNEGKYVKEMLQMYILFKANCICDANGAFETVQGKETFQFAPIKSRVLNIIILTQFSLYSVQFQPHITHIFCFFGKIPSSMWFYYTWGMSTPNIKDFFEIKFFDIFSNFALWVWGHSFLIISQAFIFPSMKTFEKCICWILWSY